VENYKISTSVRTRTHDHTHDSRSLYQLNHRGWYRSNNIECSTRYRSKNIKSPRRCRSGAAECGSPWLGFGVGIARSRHSGHSLVRPGVLQALRAAAYTTSVYQSKGTHFTTRQYKSQIIPTKQNRNYTAALLANRVRIKYDIVGIWDNEMGEASII